jgi:hypothetical protein
LNFGLKRALVYTTLALLTIWPAVHIGLAKTYGLSSWKLAGWGMYATPRPKFVGMEVYFRQRGASGYERLREATGPVGDAARVFLERYRWLGKLAFPEAFAKSILAMKPEWEQVKVVVYQPVLQRDTGMMVMREDVFEESALTQP